jgi:uncharacterized repeat protein (TIGR03833 family)
MPLQYVSDRGYRYTQHRGGKIVRVSNNKPEIKPKTTLRVGNVVTIIVKPYHAKKYVTGKVARILTRKLVHTRGRKVQLVTGEVGRIIS